jgi:spore germination cell wall hydrolase CwlJ-like protein
MNYQLNDTQINLYMRIIGFLALCTLLLAFGQTIKQNQELKSTLEDYKSTTDTTIDHLSREIATLNRAAQKVLFVERETKCLAQNIYFEAKSEPYQGKLAVATVTMNRVKSKIYPSTICDVVWQRNIRGCQFSWTCDGKPDRITSREQYQNALKIANEVLHNRKVSRIINTKTLHYHADYVSPEWADHFRPVAKIGRHIFYTKQ